MSRKIDEALLTRRDALVRFGALIGSASFAGQAALLSGCAADSALLAADSPGLLTTADVAWLDEVAETILPDTGTPGAKAAGVGPFIALMVRDTYTPDEQQRFRDGMRTLENECLSEHGVGFMAATPSQRLALLERIDREQFEFMRVRGPGQPTHYFRLIKQLTLFGYFTSEIGCTQAQRYVETPGRFDPCVPYAPGDRAWAPHA